MTLSEQAEKRLADVVALQPTKNSELQAQWDMDSGSEVHSYLESELEEYYYRNEDSLICATAEAAALVGDRVADGDDEVVTVPDLQADVLEVIAGPGEDPQSVVSVLHALREQGVDPAVDDVRSALRSLDERGLVERVQKTVPTYRRAVDRETIEISRLDGE